MLLFFEQLLNGVQFGMMLFLMAAGLTLVVGIMNLINLAHGALYMVGAFLAVTFSLLTGSYLLAVGLAVACTALIGLAIEFLVLRPLYSRDHLDQVLCTFGLILFLNELTRFIWGATPLRLDIPAWLDYSVSLAGIDYPGYRLIVILASVAVAIGLYFLIGHTRIGMLIRAGASDRKMIIGLGVNIALLYSLIFALGAGLAALAGILAAPIFTVQVGMGDHILILTLVVIVIGGIGSVRGSFAAAIVVGVIDTLGRVMLPSGFGNVIIYLLMAVILFWRPRGLFPSHA
ncbi:MAG TPA: branched-chain amino acid ABC transporter permease [Eoetvoesiella sp.]|uniref:branched-chain amino acid ABC transporter permease n=1 Tax=Eoetvoesiella sp. TaxID=1966355 RepID=UPI002BDC9ED5|nr:branched-chain amino acid ABC transporter permease [Eoetvoesiella sp.]HWK61281.1 branched-chain amino acid ABC transporter permease [Eoetvoesiella sp.]